uniref:uncharacterized protein LOC120339139 n=1 Tax=Styela clava TaxID=7725 RepID=UPI0019399960|nr:uncharacterized protein LOC120339139 [Styela clava]
MREAGIIDDILFKGITPKRPKPGRLRLQPKVHKKNHPSRPIISTNGTATEKLSAFIDYKLTNLMCKEVIPSYVRDSMDLLNILKKIDNIPPGSYLVTMDVTSLYTNIPHKDGILAVEKYLSKYTTEKREIPYIKEAVNMVLDNNNFVFDGKHYLQINGTAMGTKMAPKYANIFMADLESEILETAKIRPQYYYRYIDDCFLIWTHGETELISFINHANSIHPSIKFTFEYSTENITFLDVKVHIMDNKLETEIYTKDTDSHQYLLPSSCHPKHITANIPKGLFIRIRRSCSNVEFFDKHAGIMKRYLMQRNYEETSIDKTIKLVKEMNRDYLLTPKSTKQGQQLLPFITNYHPNQPHFRKIFSDYQYILDNNARLKEIFPQPPKIAYRKCPTLRDRLVRAKLQPVISQKVQSGFYKCNRKACTTCKYSEETKISTGNVTGVHININERISCKSKNVIYLINCKKCGMQYIGETGRSLKYRITEHLRSITKRKYDLVVGEHFNKLGHSISDFSVSGIKKLFRDQGYRQTVEAYYINKFGTLEPQGLNSREK